MKAISQRNLIHIPSPVCFVPKAMFEKMEDTVEEVKRDIYMVFVINAVSVVISMKVISQGT